MSIRKALLVGINTYPDAPLRGCINDVTQVSDLLKRYYGFQDGDIKLMLNEAATAAEIKAALAWLAQGGDDPNAVRIFHFSGHGSFVADENGDEPDGRDECLVPYDYKSVGFITDDVLGTCYDRFPVAGNLTLMMDCCHSGTIQKDISQDVIFRFLPVPDAEQERIDAATAQFATDQQEFVVRALLELRARELTEDELRQRVSDLMAAFEKKRFGDVQVNEANVLLAGCQANQTSADARIAGEYHGAFTYYLAEAIQQANGQITYRELAEKIGKRLKGGNFSQAPQLEYAGQRDRATIFRPFV